LASIFSLACADAHRLLGLDNWTLRGAALLFSGLSVEMLFGSLGIGFRYMHGTINMLGRRIERVQLQRLLAGISYVMSRAGRDDDCGVAFDFCLGAIDPNFTTSFLHSKELGPVFMNLFADFFSGAQRH
jgi:hypothetical protein